MLRCRKLKPMKDKKCAVKKQSLLVPQTGYLTCSSVRNIVVLLACSASHYSLFLPAQALPSSATGSGST